MTGYRRPGSTLRADYARREIKLRGGLRKLVAEAAVLHEDIPVAGIKLIGWPTCFVWQNLSGITGYERIAFLHQRWKKGKMSFVPVTAAEREAALATRRGRRPPRARRPKTNPEGRPHRYTRNGPKSQKWVSQAAEARTSAPMEEGPSESCADNDATVWGSSRARGLAGSRRGL
ncbi:hypothetical protein C2E23DRAFT_888908 [Lenzites betulinus]|nr:hypothetical protein C2E23DRAFT_888908 [Lenzites betulinus]